MNGLFSIAPILALGAGCALGPGRAYLLSYEVRVPHGVEFPPLAKVDVVTPASASGTRARLMTNRVDGDFTIYNADTLIFTDRRRFVVVKQEPAPAQVFELHIPRHPRPIPWSDWQRPDFLDTSEMPWANVLYDTSHETRSSGIPTNCMQVRYSVREWRFP